MILLELVFKIFYVLAFFWENNQSTKILRGFPDPLKTVVLLVTVWLFTAFISFLRILTRNELSFYAGHLSLPRYQVCLF